MTPYILLFILTPLITFFRNRKNVIVIVGLIFLVLVVFAGTRNAGIDNDYGLYKWMFKTAVKNKVIYDAEPTKFLIPQFLSWFTVDYVRVSFLVFASFSLYFKLYPLRNFQFFTLSVLLYISNLYFIQDMTTIRASVASGILIWSIKDLVNKNDKIFFLKFLLAFSFHNSAALFLIVWIISRFDVSYKFLLCFFAFSLLIPVLDINFIKILHLDFFSDKAEVYLKVKKYEDGSLNLFNFKILISFFYLIIFYWKRNDINFIGFDLLLKIHILSLILFFLFSPTGFTFSLRLFELFSIVQIVLLPLIVLIFPRNLKFIGVLLIIATSILFFYYNIFVSDIFKKYSSWLF